MTIATLLIPDFSLIVLGFLLYRYTGWSNEFWAGLEKLVYYVLFPALLFTSTARAPLDFSATGKLLQVTLGAALCGIALTWLGKPFIRTGPMVFESGAQTAFRFNSYIGLALASRLAGEQGTSLMALVIGFAVPLCNAAAVHALVHKSGGLFKGLINNPLLVATAGGLFFNMLGLHLPEIASATLTRIGNASIACGLIAVGAGLRLSGLRESKTLAAYLLAVKLLALPLFGYLAARWIGLDGMQAQMALVYCALPTASSCYVLAARMGGNGPYTAFLVSASTVLSMITLPLWLGFAG